MAARLAWLYVSYRTERALARHMSRYRVAKAYTLVIIGS